MSTAVRLAGGVGPAAREQRAAGLDTFLAGLLRDAETVADRARQEPRGATTARQEPRGATTVDGVALVATGGLGRRECAPHGDLDLLLLHRGGTAPGGVDIGTLAEQVWYPIWDARLALDHSVRTVPEALSVARDDVKVALGLLDIRHIAGDATLTAELRAAVYQRWRREADRLLPALREVTEARWQAYGELAFLLEGDLKEARGGLRDVAVLRGIGVAGIADVTRPAVRAAYTRLLDVRDALHLATGRRMDRLVAQERTAVADTLGLPNGDALLRRVSTDARAIAYVMDDGWRAVDRWRSVPARGRSHRHPIARDVVEQDGEVVLARSVVTARPQTSLGPRVAAAAAVAGLPIARATLEWLARFCPAPAVPWSPDAREALLTLLGSGPALIPVWEACDRYGLVDGWLPDWPRLRGLPQHSPVHRYTVDRHLVRTAAEAARYTSEVSRPDLLVLAALLHDTGKGLPGDHSRTGAVLAAGTARRLGLPDEDADLVGTLVRLHLLLPDTATRRDVGDPVTVRTVADAVADVRTLDLLYALTRADALATGPGAWSSWRERLVADLVARVRAALDTGTVPPRPRPDPTLVAGDPPVVHVSVDRVAVAAEDRRGLLAAVTGCLAAHRLDVVTADVSSVDRRTLLECAVQPRYGTPADIDVLRADLRRAANGDFDARPVGRVAPGSHQVEAVHRVPAEGGDPRGADLRARLLQRPSDPEQQTRRVGGT
ncbi:MAG TPA: [protein-PII] uridylyltransferase, partial [Micromonosporaceae bacterium]